MALLLVVVTASVLETMLEIIATDMEPRNLVRTSLRMLLRKRLDARVRARAMARCESTSTPSWRYSHRRSNNVIVMNGCVTSTTARTSLK
jgi:hypothetical protein